MLPSALQGAVFADLQGSPVASGDLAADAEAAVAAAAGAVVASAEPSRMARMAVSLPRTPHGAAPLVRRPCTRPSLPRYVSSAVCRT